jgi:hypothetical protein
MENYYRTQMARAAHRRDQLLSELQRNYRRQFVAASLLRRSSEEETEIRAERHFSGSTGSAHPATFSESDDGTQSEADPTESIASRTDGPASSDSLGGDEKPGSSESGSPPSADSEGPQGISTGSNSPSPSAYQNTAGPSSSEPLPSGGGTNMEASLPNPQGSLPASGQSLNGPSQLLSLAQANSLRFRNRFNPYLNYRLMNSMALNWQMNQVLSGTAPARAP